MVEFLVDGNPMTQVGDVDVVVSDFIEVIVFVRLEYESGVVFEVISVVAGI